MPRKKKVTTEAVSDPSLATPTPTEVVQKAAATDPALLEALKGLGLVFSQAIQENKPVKKINAAERKVNNAWTKPGEKKPKLKRKLYHHGIWLDPDMLTTEQIELANKLIPGTYCDGVINIVRRRDKGINIDYRISTAAQRLKLNRFGITSFDGMLQRLIDEAADPKHYKNPDDLD